eukprot:5144793-Prymnesium_polylepis.1
MDRRIIIVPFLVMAVHQPWSVSTRHVPSSSVISSKSWTRLPGPISPRCCDSSAASERTNSFRGVATRPHSQLTELACRANEPERLAATLASNASLS